MKHTILVMILTLGLYGCGDADKVTVSKVAQACAQNMNLNQAICDCVAEKAKQELSPRGFDFFYASMIKDSERTEKLRSEMAMPEVMAAGMFMVSGPTSCTLKQPDKR